MRHKTLVAGFKLLPVANQSVSNKGTTRQVFFQQQQPKEPSAKRGEGKKDLADRFIN